MARIHGKKGDVLLDPTGGATGVSLASCDGWELNLEKDRVDVTCFQDENKQSVLGLPSYSGSMSGAWDSATTPEQLFAVIFGDVPAMITLIPNTLEETFLFKGLGNLDGALSVSAKGAVTWSSKFDAAGPWTMEPAILP
ncbi:MAG: hypothetical protein EHM91_00055 [Planctomycetota bacterium]|nr:MAG: hypothetical protein EHM91_00055 [Planctomycetota bacterium]